MRNSIVVRSVAGPDSGWTVQLEPGSHWLGRTGGGVQLLDPSIEMHHALIGVDDEGRASLLQTAGRNPVRVDGAPAHGWVRLDDGGTVELGDSRLQIGANAFDSGALVDWVFEPQDRSNAEVSRFARDVRLAVATARRRAFVRAAGAVELGVAEVDLDVDVRRSDGTTVELGDLDHSAHAIVDRERRAVVPVGAVLSPDRPVALVASEPHAVASALLAQLPADERARVLVADAAESEVLIGSGRPLLVLVHDAVDVPRGVGAILDVGSTWRATWCADVVDRPHEIVRLHARGHAERGGRVGTASSDVDRPFVAEEVARAHTEFGRDVVGVPQTARRQ